MTVAVAILAAGSGTRFSKQGSGPKPLANLRDFLAKSTRGRGNR